MSFSTEPLLGWRLWHVRDGRLLSWVKPDQWPGGARFEARCRRLRGCGEAPRAGHSCGIYAARTRELALQLLEELPSIAGPVAVGRVSLWGRVIENVDGWRAQYAYPYDLELVAGTAADAAGLRRVYAVDARPA